MSDHPSMAGVDETPEDVAKLPRHDVDERQEDEEARTFSRASVLIIAACYFTGGLVVGRALAEVKRREKDDTPVRQWQIRQLDGRIHLVESELHAHAERHEGIAEGRAHVPTPS